MAETPLLYRVPDACAAIGVGKSRLYELVNAGRIRPVKIGRSTLIPRTELERFTAELVEGGGADGNAAA